MLILIYVILTAVAIAPFIVATLNYRSYGDLGDSVAVFVITIGVIGVTSIFFGFLAVILSSALGYF